MTVSDHLRNLTFGRVYICAALQLNTIQKANVRSAPEQKASYNSSSCISRSSVIFLVFSISLFRKPNTVSLSIKVIWNNWTNYGGSARSPQINERDDLSKQAKDIVKFE